MVSRDVDMFSYSLKPKFIHQHLFYFQHSKHYYFIEVQDYYEQFQVPISILIPAKQREVSLLPTVIIVVHST